MRAILIFLLTSCGQIEDKVSDEIGNSSSTSSSSSSEAIAPMVEPISSQKVVETPVESPEEVIAPAVKKKGLFDLGNQLVATIEKEDTVNNRRLLSFEGESLSVYEVRTQLVSIYGTVALSQTNCNLNTDQKRYVSANSIFEGTTKLKASHIGYRVVGIGSTSLSSDFIYKTVGAPVNITVSECNAVGKFLSARPSTGWFIEITPVTGVSYVDAVSAFDNLSNRLTAALVSQLEVREY